jgi:hypothetical protein
VPELAEDEEPEVRQGMKAHEAKDWRSIAAGGLPAQAASD